MPRELKLTAHQKAALAVPEDLDQFNGGTRGGGKSWNLFLQALRHGGHIALAGDRSAAAQDREVVGLGAAACEEDFTRLRAEGLGDDASRVFQGRGGLPTPSMQAGGVAEGIGEVGIHRLSYL